MPTGAEPMQVYAFAGDGSADTAAAVAKLLSRAARKERLDVLAIDACGGALAEKLCVVGADAGAGEEDTSGATPPDAFLTRTDADPERLGEHIARSRFSTLRVIRAPKNTSLPAFALQEAAGEVFELCVVACGDAESAYAEDWLLAADRVVACSSDGPEDALDTARWVEEKRDANGTMLALMGANGGGRAPETEYPDHEEGEAEEAVRRLYTLGPGFDP